MRKSFVALIAGAAIVLAVSQANANSVVNGDFEDQFNSGWTHGNWQIFGSGSFSAGGNYIAGTGDPNIHDTDLEQSLITQPGQNYVLTFDYNPEINANSTVTAELQVYWNGTLVDDLVNGAGTWNTYTVMNLTASSSSTLLEFQASNGDGLDAGLDNVDVELAATPLPAALPLFATGLGFLGWAARRRKQKATALAA